MKRAWTAVALVGLLGLVACAAVDSAKVDGTRVAAQGGEPVAVISTWQGGFTLFWGLVPLGPAGQTLDDAIHKNLITEAKAHGGDRVQMVTVFSLPADHLFARIQPLLLLPGLLNFHFAYASGIAVMTGEGGPIGVIEGLPAEMQGVPALEPPPDAGHAVSTDGGMPADGGPDALP
ncbi:MAG: hypothetical protein AB2A00_20470 [Myxococcota bacterium]